MVEEVNIIYLNSCSYEGTTKKGECILKKVAFLLGCKLIDATNL